MKISLILSLILLSASCSYFKPEQNIQAPVSSETSKLSETDIKVRFWLNRIEKDKTDSIAKVKAGAALVQLARESGRQNYYLQAEQILRDSIHMGASSYDTLVMLSFALSAQHRFNESVEFAKQAIEIDPYKETAWAALGDAYLEQGQIDLAEETYNKLLSFGSSFFSLTRIANLTLFKGNYEESISILRSALEIGEKRGVNSKELARVYTQIGENNFQRGLFNKADIEYNKALELWPDGYLPMEHLAELRAYQQRFTESRNLYEQVIKIAPYPEILEVYAGVLQEIGEQDQANRIYKQVLDHYYLLANSGDSGYYRTLALFLTDQEMQPEKALDWAKKDLAIRPTSESYIVLAWVLHQLGNIDEAELWANKALDHKIVLNAENLFRAAVIYQSAKKNALAIDLYTQAKALNPRHSNLTEIENGLLNLM